MEYRIKAPDLDVTTLGGATKRELEYANERRHIPLKGKYRPKRASLPQWGTGSDRNGPHQQDKAKSVKAASHRGRGW